MPRWCLRLAPLSSCKWMLCLLGVCILAGCDDDAPQRSDAGTAPDSATDATHGGDDPDAATAEKPHAPDVSNNWAGGRGGKLDAGLVRSPMPAPDAGTTDAPATFPLRISDNHHYLIDRNGRPFLINQVSAWGLIQSLSLDDATSFIDELQRRGFNTLLVSVISNDKRMPGDPPAWQGIAPFKQEWDFSTPNPDYFAHADQILELAKSRGMLVALVACYLGFPNDPTQGWADELLDATNNLDKSREYGRYLGSHFQRFDNLIWVAGGDNFPVPGGKLEQHMKAVMDGVRENDPRHLWTAHWSGLEEGSVATDQPTFAESMDLNGYYAFDYDLTYLKDLESITRYPDKPLYHLDMAYETERGGDPESIRRRAYTAILSGAVGSSFNAGPNWYLFENWRAMGSPATAETEYWYRFFVSWPWQELEPDIQHEAVTAGYGTFGSEEYVCVAHTAEWDLIIAYLPHGGTLTVDLSRLTGSSARVYWFDPTKGTTTEAERNTRHGRAELSAPSAQSWVLVVQDAASARGMPALPGSTGG